MRSGTRALGPGEFEDVSLLVPGPMPAEPWVVVDDMGGLVGELVECEETPNNLVTGAPAAIP